MLKALLIGLALAQVTLACKTTSSRSAVKVIGGVEDYTYFPAAVGLLIKTGEHSGLGCTGTVVRDDLILTAAHCVKYKEEQLQAVYVYHNLAAEGGMREAIKKNPSSRKVVVFPTYDPDRTLHNADVAFVIFPHGTFSGHPMAKIASSSVKGGDTVGLVGYGMIGIEGPNSAPTNAELNRYRGSNTVDKVKDYLASAITLRTDRVGVTTSLSGHGDSGGPLVNAANEVAGICMEGGISNFFDETITFIDAKHPGWSLYTNVTDAGIAAFIQAVMRESNPSAATGQSVTPTKE